jgi:predicted nucleotidyltransferase
MDFSQPFGGLMPGPRGAVLTALLRTGTPLGGRQLHRLIADRVSLTSVQTQLRELTALGIVVSDRIGASGVHRINESHALVAPLRAMADPFALLRHVVGQAVAGAQCVLVFGSVARGEATATSDIDLAAVAPVDWAGRYDLQERVTLAFGNACDVLVLTEDDYFSDTEPVAAEIRRDGITLYGERPLRKGEP